MYKAFNENLKCRDYQFEVGKTYAIEGEPILCKRGFHFCRDMQKCFNYYDMDSRICEIIAEDIIEGDHKSVCRKITITRELSKQEIMDKITDSGLAYRWASYIGNKDVMIDKITDSLHAYHWALHFGNLEVMIDRITDSQQAYLWALHIGNREVMIGRITDSKFAYGWAKGIGNQEVMIDRVTDSEWAYWWAIEIGNRDVMLPRITDELQRRHIERIIREKV